MNGFAVPKFSVAPASVPAKKAVLPALPALGGAR